VHAFAADNPLFLRWSVFDKKAQANAARFSLQWRADRVAN